MADDKLIRDVWNKGATDSTNDSNVWRRDECGAWMCFSQYGNRNSPYGWEIDHITSQNHNGPDSLSNLRPLQWQNNLSKSSGRLKCVVKAVGENNVPID